MVALTDLVTDPALGLEVVASPESVEGRQILSAAVSELTAPGSWLQGGELLMTIGLLLPMTDADCTAYVEDLTTAGVRALGLGLGAELPHQRAPSALVAAAERAGLPLLTVPDGVPFIAVTKAVFARQAAQERAELEWAVQAQRTLTEVAVRPGGLEAILASHHGVSDCPGVVVDLLGRVLGAAGCKGEDLFLHLAGLVESIRDRGLAAAAVDTADGVRREVHPLGSHRLRGWLLLEGRADRTPSHLVTSGLVSLITLELERRHAFEEADRQARTRVFDRLARSRVDDVTAARVLASVGLPNAARLCAAVQVLPEDSGPDGLASDLAAGLPDTLIRTHSDVVELSAPGTADLQAVVSRLAPGRPLGVGGLVPPTDLAKSLRQARSALAASRITGAPVSSEDLAGHDPLSLLPTPLLEAYSDAVLSVLDTAEGSTELIAALRAFLATNGSWEASATALGVHRHTARHRIERVERATGRSLGDPQDRLELSLALHARDRGDS